MPGCLCTCMIQDDSRADKDQHFFYFKYFCDKIKSFTLNPVRILTTEQNGKALLIYADWKDKNQ